LALAKGEPIDDRDRDERTPLFQAVVTGRVDLVLELVRSGAQVNAKDRDGRTPLHVAAIQCQIDTAKALVEAGATVDARDKNGNTPLSNAVFYSKGRGELIHLLRKNGANPDAANNHGVSPRKLAETIANFDVRRFLD
jgi:ankyrin repeat protein